MRRLLLAAVLSFVSLPALRAQAIITWGTAQVISGDTDVSTTGTSTWAYNFGGSGAGNFTLNTVNFVGVDSGSVSSNIAFATTEGGLNEFETAFNTGAAPFSSLSANYQSLLRSAAYWENDPAATNTITLNGLTVGNSYQLEIWSDDSRGAGAGRSSVFNDNLGNAVTLDLNQGDVDGGLGSFVLGTFVASGSSEVLHGLIGTGSVIQFNAIQLRDVTGVSSVPEPSTYAAIGGIAALALAIWNRRRLQQA